MTPASPALARAGGARRPACRPRSRVTSHVTVTWRSLAPSVTAAARRGNHGHESLARATVRARALPEPVTQGGSGRGQALPGQAWPGRRSESVACHRDSVAVVSVTRDRPGRLSPRLRAQASHNHHSLAVPVMSSLAVPVMSSYCRHQ